MNSELLYQWNEQSLYPSSFVLVDETLRDGLQGPGVVTPSLEEKLLLIDQMAKNRVDQVTVSFPASSETAFKQSFDIIDYVEDHGYDLSLSFLCRMVKNDLLPLVELQKHAKRQLFGFEFIACSPIRQYVERWDLDFIKTAIIESTRFLKNNGLKVILGFEDTTRSHPDDLRALIAIGLEAGADVVCLADTVGHIDPSGVKALISFVRSITGQSTILEWHGHNDRGLALINALSALSCGVDAIHATSLGIGERAGNLCLETFLINLYLAGQTQIDLSHLNDYAQLTSQFTQVPIPSSMPGLGPDIFTTGTGIHASAIYKALNQHDLELADLVYSSVPAGKLNRKQNIEIWPMSGRANVLAKCSALGLPCTDTQIAFLLKMAKQSDRFLSHAEILKAMEIC